MESEPHTKSGKRTVPMLVFSFLYYIEQSCLSSVLVSPPISGLCVIRGNVLIIDEKQTKKPVSISSVKKGDKVCIARGSNTFEKVCCVIKTRHVHKGMNEFQIVGIFRRLSSHCLKRVPFLNYMM